MNSRRTSARIANKFKTHSFTNYQNTSTRSYYTDSSDEDSIECSPRKTKLKTKSGGSPSKQSKLETPVKNKTQCTANTPPFARLSIKSPTKPKSSRKSLFKENKSDENAVETSSSEVTESEDDIKNKSVYQSARIALQGVIPTELPGREEELGQLRSFIQERIDNKSSGSLYVSGPPGTGKTASLYTILGDKNFESKLTYVYVNCTAIKSPTVIYARIIKELKLKLSGKTEKEHLMQIDGYLKKKHKPILMVLDEIDQLETKNQSILYTIFEWPSKPNSQIILIGIANALDLTDRILPRLQSRLELKPKLLQFAPYTKSQIVDIFTSRLKTAGVLDLFTPSAVQMLAGKVAAVSGDVRRALDIGRRVVELAEQSRQSGTLKSVENISDDIQNVDLKQVISVLNKVYSTTQNLEENTDEFPLQQKIIICTVLLMKKIKNRDITVGKLHEVYRKVCKKRNIGAVDQTEFVGLCSLIETRGIIDVVKKKEVRLSKVNLMWDEDEIRANLKDKQLISEILQDETCLT